MVETRRKRKENPDEDKKKPSSMKKAKAIGGKPKPRVKFVRTASPPSIVAPEITTTVEKTTVEPINVLVEAAVTVDANKNLEGSKPEGSEPEEEEVYEDAVDGSGKSDNGEDSEKTISDKDEDGAGGEEEETTACPEKEREDAEVEESEEEEEGGEAGKEVEQGEEVEEAGKEVEQGEEVEEAGKEVEQGEEVEEAGQVEDEEVETDSGRDNPNDNDEVSEPTEAIKPSGMWFPVSEYHKQIKLGTRCNILDAVQTLEQLRPKLSNVERKWFEDHPQFRHFFHMKREKSHKVQGMWMLLMRTCEITREREVWFVVNGVPIRYGLREHALLSGLNCWNYPLGYKEKGSTRFVERHFKRKDGTMELMRLEDVKAKLLKMGAHRDRLKMAVLFFLGSVICAQTKSGDGARNVLEFFQRAVDDLDFCKSFPWGRYSFDYMVKEITHTLEHFGGTVREKSLWPLPGFCVPLEILAFEAIPKLGRKFRQPVVGADANCPRMCRWSFKPNGMRGMPLSDIYQELGDEITDILSIIPALSEEEEAMLEEIYEEDDDVDKVDISVESWEKRLDEGWSICFEDMFEADVAARTKPPEPVEEGEEETERAIESGGDISKMMKMMKKMVKQLGRVEKKVGTFESRLDSVEDLVKEVQKGNKKK